MEAHNLFDADGVIIELPDLSVAISNEPMIGASNHGDDVGGTVVGRVHNYLLLDWGNSDLKEITSLSIVNILELPPLDVAVATGSNEQLFFLIENNDLDETFVQGSLLLLIEHQVSLYQVTIPKNESSVLGSAKDLAIGELTDASDV